MADPSQDKRARSVSFENPGTDTVAPPLKMSHCAYVSQDIFAATSFCDQLLLIMSIASLSFIAAHHSVFFLKIGCLSAFFIILFMTVPYLGLASSNDSI